MTSIIAVVHVTACLTAAILVLICLVSAVKLQAEKDLLSPRES